MKTLTLLSAILLQLLLKTVSAQDTTGFQYLTDTTKILPSELKTQAHQNRLLPSVIPWELQFRFTTSNTIYTKKTTSIKREELELILAKNLSFVAPYARTSSLNQLLEYIRLHSVKTKYEFQTELDESVWYGKDGYSTFLKFFLERAIYSNELFISELAYKIYQGSGELDTTYIQKETAYTRRSISVLKETDWWPEMSYTYIGFQLGYSNYIGTNAQVFQQLHLRMQANQWIGDIHSTFNLNYFEAIHGSLQHSWNKVEQALIVNLGLGGSWNKQSYLPQPFLISELQFKLHQRIQWNRETLIFKRPAHSVLIQLGSRYYPINNQIGFHLGLGYSIFGINPYRVTR